MPAVTSYPSQSWGLVGDGLSAYEEYRGFIVRGEHHRTSLVKKDLFITRVPTWEIGYASNLELVGVRVHMVRGDASGEGQSEHSESGAVTDRFVNLEWGGSIPSAGSTVQKALRISLNPTYEPGTYGKALPLEIVRKVPFDVTGIEIWVDSIMALAHESDWGLTGVSRRYTLTEAENEVRRTFGHEVGHGIAICHLQGCASDVSEEGRPISVMGNAPREGPPPTSPLSQYSAFDQGLIRFHRRP
jgi:hypothetical protein